MEIKLTFQDRSLHIEKAQRWKRVYPAHPTSTIPSLPSETFNNLNDKNQPGNFCEASSAPNFEPDVY